MVYILQVLSSLHRNGTETSIMNIYRELDKSIFQFDFLIFDNQNMDFFDEIKSLGGNIYYIPSRRNNFIKYVIGCCSFFRKYSHKYNVVHFNFCYLNLLLPFLLAKYYKIHTRICHSHSSSYVGSKLNLYLHLLFRRIVITLCTNYLACSKEAAEWFYMNTSAMNNFKIIRNGINIDKFLFKDDVRKQYRNSIDLEDNDILVGQIGYYALVKNHLFTLSFMSDVFKSNSHVKLVLIGSGGSLEKNIISQINTSQYRDRIIILGKRNDVHNWMQAMDILIMPSLFEGLPITLIEAQVSGLKILASEHISKESKCTENIDFLPIERKDIWQIHLNNMIGYRRYNLKELFIASPFSIHYSINQLISIYHNKV